MGWDGSGQYTRQRNFSADASAGIRILASAMDQEVDDIASAFNNVLPRDGQAAMTGNLPMGGNRLINVGEAQAVNDYMRSREFIENVPIYMVDNNATAGTVSVSAQFFTSVSATQAPRDGTKIMVRMAADKAQPVMRLSGHSANIHFAAGPRVDTLVSGELHEFVYSSASQVWETFPERQYYSRTAAEISAGVTPTNYQYAPYDLSRYGAAINGSTDDGTAVRNWLLASMQAGAQAFSTVSGTALCTTFTTLNTSSTLRINAPGLTIKGPATPDDFCRPGGNVYCYNVTFDRWLSVFETELADADTLTALEIKGNKFTNISSIPINIEATINNYRIEGNDFDTCTGGYAIKIGENTYANQDNYVEGWILKNRFNDISATSTTSVAAMLVYGKKVTIKENIIENISQTGTGEAWGIYTKVRLGTIEGNIINDVLADGNADIQGINIKGATRLVTSSPQGYAITCVGNIISNIGVAGSKGGGIRAQSDDILIAANFCQDTGLGGITTDNSAGYYAGVRIDNNSVYFSSITSGVIGIAASGQGSGVAVTNNTIRNCAAGIYTYSVTGDFDEPLIAQNTIVDCTTALFFDASSGTTLQNPVFDDNFLSGSITTGILFNGSAGTVTGLKLRRTNISIATTPISGSLGTNPVLADLHEASETLTGTATASLYTLVSDLNSNGGAVTATLPDGLYEGQRKVFTMSDASASSTVSATSHETSDPEVFTFAEVTDYLVLEWSESNAYWWTVKNIGVAV